MALMHHRPNEVRDFTRQLNRLFDAPLFAPGTDFSTVETSQWVPEVDIREEDQRFVVEADVPGVDPENIEVTLDNGALTIRGERQEERTSDAEGVRRVERAHGEFYRRFPLPDTADPENVRARGEKGVLHIEIGKRQTAQSRRIPVQTQ